MLKRPLRLVKRAGTRLRLALDAPRAGAFLASYPKSGRTWFRFILANYFGAVVCPPVQVDLHSMFSVLPNFDHDPVRGLPAFRFADRPEVPLILVGHQPYRRMLFRGRPVIFMVRDPRDVLVSAYFHSTRHKQRYAGSIDTFLSDRQLGLPALIEYLNGWGDNLSRHPHMVLSYEELSADPASATARVLAFLGRPVDAAALAKAVTVSNFEAMQEREKNEGIPSHDYDRGDEESLRMRRGKAGGFTDYLSQADIAMIEREGRALLSPGAKAIVAKTGFRM